LGRAAEGAETDEEHAGVLAIRGMNASDAGDYSRALPWLSESIERAAACGDERQQAWSLSILGRAHLLRGEYRQADLAIARSLRLVDAQRWLAFQPWPQALHAELQLLAGDVGAALYELEQAWSLACTLADPCWEAMAARGIALTRRASGDPEGARHWLTDAQARCVRVTDPYQWVHAYVLDAAAADAIACGDHVSARSAVRSLTELAERCEMQEMTVRALVHQHALGDPTALTAARLAAHGLDNPQLEREYAAN
jgi:tetratricopeptide (TPR) repeat protein